MKITPDFFVKNEPAFVKAFINDQQLLNIVIIKYLEFHEIVKVSLLCKRIHIIIDPNDQISCQTHDQSLLSCHFWHVIFAQKKL